jgi:peptide/nickel transport system permease protein
MSDLDNTTGTPEPVQPVRAPQLALDDQRRIKVLSPGMLVAKRFLRNKLALVGLVILVVMFIFSFLGPVLSPYTQTEVFYTENEIDKDYAGAIINTELRYVVADDQEFGALARANFLLAFGKQQSTFTSNNIGYSYIEEADGTYRILQLERVAEDLLDQLIPARGKTIPEGLEDAYFDAKAAKESIFELDGETYYITTEGRKTYISSEINVALASLSIYDAYNPDDSSIVDSYPFRYASSIAIRDSKTEFEVSGTPYVIEYGEGITTIKTPDGTDFAEVSNIIVNPLDQREFLPVEFKTLAREVINERGSTFLFDGIEYKVVRVNTNYYIKRETTSVVIKMFDFPTPQHPVGTDNNGMDQMTRLMYGGRVSLMVGFVVVLLETVIGVIIGGISGYFSGNVDTALMRFVDLFNSIPYFPMIIIFGSVMDTLEVSPMARLFILMAILGLMGWTGIARLVRGQILSLREQDFMVATEATGIRTSRKIFRHLVPNVMPLLIVIATGSLGGVIIFEATLGFLGLGIKYPLASWGSIINIASDPYVMTTYWFIWLPAGMLILLTVLGFNFVGDGLRDAYDPKMKR